MRTAHDLDREIRYVGLRSIIQLLIFSASAGPCLWWHPARGL